MLGEVTSKLEQTTEDGVLQMLDFIFVHTLYLSSLTGHKEFNAARMLVLYRGLPSRCHCGHWFKLVDMDEYERMREQRWDQIKVEPINAELLKDFDDSEKELRRLMEQTKNMTIHTPGAPDLLTQMSVEWKKMKGSYFKIRRAMELP